MNRAEKAAETRKRNKLEKAIADKKLLESVQGMFCWYNNIRLPMT